MSPVPSDSDQLPTEALLRLPLREVDDDADEPMPYLVALHQRPAREVFDAAAALVEDHEPIQRELGVRILRELGEPQPDGRRPFSVETIPLLRARLRTEPDSGVLAWIISALGYQHAREALPEALPFAGHPDPRVRFHVAAAMPGLVAPTGVEPDVEAALLRLCQDDDADTRYYALDAATREVAGMNTAAMTELTARLLDDPDDQVRALAAAYHADRPRPPES